MVELYIVNCDKHQGIKLLCVFFDVEIFVFDIFCIFNPRNR